MDRNRRNGTPLRGWRIARGLVLVSIALATSNVNSESGTTDATATSPAFALVRATIDAGGARSSGSTFVVNGTIGQHDAEPLQPSVGGPFAVTGGFWTRVVASPPPGDEIFSNGFEGM